MAATFNIGKRIDVRSISSNIDALYGPYNSLEDACIAVPINRRAIGRTVAIIENGSAIEYWWKSGLTDEDLIVKVMESVPKLEYTDDNPEGTTLRASLGIPLSVKVRFTSQSYGQCTLTVYKDNNLLKTIKADKGVIIVDLGTPANEGTCEYLIKGVDSRTIPASESLTFRAVIGGAKISSDFQDILDSGINTSSSISITYNASTADTSKTIKVLGELIDSNEQVVTSYTNEGVGNNAYVLSNQIWSLGTIVNPGEYTLKLTSYTGESVSDTSEDIAVQYYNFILMEPNAFEMSSSVSELSTDTNNPVVIPYRIYSGSRMTVLAKGEILDSNEEVVSSFELSVPSNTLKYWSPGKISTAGNYTIYLWATTVGNEESPSGLVTIEIPLTISQYIPDYEITRTNLLAEFVADGRRNDNIEDTRGYWRNSVSNSDLYFQLVDLNYNTNGWKHVDESLDDSDPSGEMMLKFTGDSYGILKQKEGNTPALTDPNYNILQGLGSSENTGFTAEVIFRTRCIGELNSKVITSHRGKDTNTAGFSASFNKVSIGSNDSQVVLDVAEEEWIHATMVIDKTIHTEVDDVQDYAPRKLMTVYINGSACASSIITDNMTFTNNGPTILNAAINTSTNLIDYFGACEIKTIRFYGRPLRASEVVNNYIASIFNQQKQSEVVGKNGNALPIVRFININNEHPQYPIKDGNSLVNFSTLNQMTEKARQKKDYTCARVLYQENSDSEVIEWSRCIIQTQGTSTLAFPVKNYKIRLYDDPDNQDGTNPYSHKYKTDVFDSKGWERESVFTLKCDYMEAAHLNNTPSCEFYNNMIDSLIEDGTIKDGWNQEHTVYTASNDERTPSRRDGHFDAIKGFPCLVYYYESESDYISGNGTYVGSYMFNLDKSAKSLGFDAPAELDEDGETIIPVLNPRTGEDAEHICQSFEGVANGSDTAGCFFSYEDWKTSYYNTYLDKAYTSYLEEQGQLSKEDFVEYYLSHQDEVYRTNSQNLTNDEEIYDDGGYLKTKEDYISAASPYADEYSYFAADYEIRYDWDDLEEGDSEFWGNSTWGLKRMIDWVSSASSTAGTNTKEDQTRDIFRRDFNNYFNLKYVLLYYLQMMVFGQVDNAGKNSMWDTWDGLHWAPRPYDLDTMAGLDNTGFEVINPDAELIRELSPFLSYNNTTGTARYYEDISELANLRYRAYNTRTSKFWIAFSKSFATEIKSMYAHLRDSGIYTINYIMNHFLSKTSDVIGESYYNRDMATKFYKLSEIETFITRMHGNRVQRFKAWMTQRIIFCDSLFDYTSPTLSLNNNIILRSDAMESGNTISKNIAIKVYSPEYVRIDVGSGYDAKIEAYCSPNSEYIDPITMERKEGTLFTIPLAAGDKEIQISGGGNIREIVNLGELKPKSLTLNYAKKINSLDLSNSTKLLALSLANNTYLQSLDCRGDVQLGTDASGAQLDLSNCVNLKYVYLDNTKLTSVVFPRGGSLKTISLKNTAITALSLDSLHFLTSVDVLNCNKIITYSITNCPKIQSITANDLPLVTVSITDCNNLQSVSLQSDNSITDINIARCPNIQVLDFKNNRSNSLNTIDLTTLYSLTSLDISGSTVETIKFPKNVSDTDHNNLWGNNFTSFALRGSSIKYVQYGETPSSGINMGQLTALNSITFRDCQSVENIYNLTYVGSCSNLFNSCSNLQSISGNITCNGSADYMFAYCHTLSDISGITFNFNKCTNLTFAFRECPWVSYSEIKRVFDNCGISLTSLYGVCYMKPYLSDGSIVNYNNANTPSAYTELPSGFFGNCKNVTTLYLGFCNSKLTAIPENAFKDDNDNIGLENCTNFYGAFGNNSGITQIPLNIMQLIPEAEDIRGMFGLDSGINITLPSEFFEPSSGNVSKVKYIQSLFYGCTNLIVNISNMASLLNPLTEITSAALLFAKCNKCTGTVPEGFFASNTKLTNISGCFSETKISGLPSGSLFRVSGDTQSTINTLSRISGLFNNCTALTGVINSDLFAGAPNIEYAGIYEESIYPSGSKHALSGVFYNTPIVMFGEDLFNNMPNLKDISGFFSSCSNLVSDWEANANILNTHQYLTNVSKLFSGCNNISNVIPSLFTQSKGTITNVSNLFEGCNISGFDQNLFTGMSNLTNASGMFKNCTRLGINMDNNADIFAGCSSLQNTSELFYGCENLTGSIPARLFNSCRNTIINVSKMFQNCTGLNGTIGTGNEHNTDLSNPNFQLGLLAECLNLTDASYMFSGCIHLSGQLPWDMFWTSSTERLYSNLTTVKYLFNDCGFGQPVVYNNENYIFHPDMFNKLISLIDAEGLLRRSRSNNIINWSSSYELHPNSFSGQYFLNNVKEMFYCCSGLGGSIANNLFNNCMSSIINAYGIFARTNITTVGPLFLRANSDVANTTLRYASGMFYDCTSLTSDIPEMNNTSKFSRIDYSDSDNGYKGYAYNTSATNASNFSGAWIQSKGNY